MKPRVSSTMAYPLRRDEAGKVYRGEGYRVWIVDFGDCCGEWEDFPTFRTALRFAYHVATGGKRWEFIA